MGIFLGDGKARRAPPKPMKWHVNVTKHIATVRPCAVVLSGLPYVSRNFAGDE